jgi:hypothetical protein
MLDAFLNRQGKELAYRRSQWSVSACLFHHPIQISTNSGRDKALKIKKPGVRSRNITVERIEKR